MTSVYTRGIKRASLLSPIQRAPAAIKPADMRGEKGGRRFAHLYKTKRWQKLRAEVLLRDMYTCQLCGAVGAAAKTLVCDHVRGHPANETEKMFWAGPFQCVCADCHNRIRAREDNARRIGIA